MQRIKRPVMGTILFGVIVCGCFLFGRGLFQPDAKGGSWRLSDIYRAIQDTNTLPPMLSVEGERMTDYFGIELQEVEQAVLLLAEDSLLADEIWMVEAADENALFRVRELAEARLMQKDMESVTYSPQQNRVVKQAAVVQRGRYFFLIVSPDVEILRKALEEQLG